MFLVLTGGRGEGEFRLVCVREDTGEPLFTTRRWTIRFPASPLEVVGVPFRVAGCTFPTPGRYSVQFWSGEVMVEERPIRMR